MNPTALSPTGVGLFKPLPTGGARDRMPTTELEDPRVKLMRKWSQEMPEAARAGLHARGGEEEDEEPNADARSTKSGISAYSTFSRAPSVMSATFLEAAHSNAFQRDLHKAQHNSALKVFKGAAQNHGAKKGPKKGNRGQQRVHQTVRVEHGGGHVVVHHHTQANEGKKKKKKRNNKKKNNKGQRAHVSGKIDHSNPKHFMEDLSSVSADEVAKRLSILMLNVKKYTEVFKAYAEEMESKGLSTDELKAITVFIETPNAQTLEKAYQTLDVSQKMHMAKQKNNNIEKRKHLHGVAEEEVKVVHRFKAYLVLPEELTEPQYKRRVEADHGPFKLALNLIYNYWTILYKFYQHLIAIKVVTQENPMEWNNINQNLYYVNMFKSMWEGYVRAYESKAKNSVVLPGFSFETDPAEYDKFDTWHRASFPALQPGTSPSVKMLPPAPTQPIVYVPATPESSPGRTPFVPGKTPFVPTNPIVDPRAKRALSFEGGDK